MPHHWPKSTVEAQIFCNRCMKMTQWKIADGRQQFCLACYDAKKAADDAKKAEPEDTQGKLF